MVVYEFASLEDVFQGVKRTPYIKALELVREAALERAKEVFDKIAYGGMVPREGEFCEVTLRPDMFYGINDTPLTDSFRQYIPTTGWIYKYLRCDLSSGGRVKTNFVMGICGIAIVDPVIRISKIRLNKGDLTYPVIDIETAKLKGRIAIIFNIPEDEVQDFVFDHTADFYMDVCALSTGYQTIIPLGVAYLPKDKATVETFPT